VGVMALAKEDITPGWYWARFSDGILEIINVAINVNAAGRGDTIVWYAGDQDAETLVDAMKLYDFIARIEPPEGNENLRIIIKGEFALILAVAGHDANEQTLERLADVVLEGV